MNRELIEKYRAMDKNGVDWLETSEKVKLSIKKDFPQQIGPFILETGGKYLETVNRDEIGDIEECFFTGAKEHALELYYGDTIDVLLQELLISDKINSDKCIRILKNNQIIYELKLLNK